MSIRSVCTTSILGTCCPSWYPVLLLIKTLYSYEYTRGNGHSHPTTRTCGPSQCMVQLMVHPWLPAIYSKHPLSLLVLGVLGVWSNAQGHSTSSTAHTICGFTPYRISNTTRRYIGPMVHTNTPAVTDQVNRYTASSTVGWTHLQYHYD